MRPRHANLVIFGRVKPNAALLLALLFGSAHLAAPLAEAGGLIRAPAVGGVHIDAEGVVSAPAAEGSEALQAAWQSALDPTPADLEPLTDLRFVSLRGVEEQIAEANRRGEPIPDAVRYLSGLLRVKHVLVYPPSDDGSTPGDIVLAGPAEGWKVDSIGNTVGITTGRPVLMLEDLIVALRSGESSNGAGISCSIDPTQEGLARAQRVQRSLTAAEGPLTASRRLEQALGQQRISIAGVPASSHFARTLVAADFRMKRLAMGFEASPVDGLPSYLEMINARDVKQNLLPRWWLATDYEPLLRDASGLAWEIRGRGVKCQSEEDFVSSAGVLERGAGRKGGDATRWAEMMSEKFDELADHDSSFGQVRNAFDLAVVAALLAKEDLWNAAGLTTPWLSERYELERYSVPRNVATQATFLKKGRKWVVTASGGVQVFPWQIADRVEVTDNPTVDAAGDHGRTWWWQ